VSTRLHTGEDWELQARVVDSDRRDFAVRTANRDQLLYRFGPDDLLSDILVNNEVVLRSKSDPAQNTIELQHVKAVEEYAIGDLTALSTPKKTEKIMAVEKLTSEKDKLNYSRGQMVDGHLRPIGELDFAFTDNGVAFEGGDLGRVNLRSQTADIVVEDSPAGTRTFEFEPGTNVLRKMTFRNRDSLEFVRHVEPSGSSRIVLKATRGPDKAEVSISSSSITMKDYDGTQTVYQFADSLLERMESPAGVTRYQYSKPGQLERIIFPDNSALQFRWTEAANLLRLTISRQAPTVEGKQANSRSR